MEQSRRQWQKSLVNSHRNQPPWERAIKQGKTQNPIILKTYYQVKNPLRIRQARSLQNNDDSSKRIVSFGRIISNTRLKRDHQTSKISKQV